ncbi:Fc receptor-like protein 4 isoform X3 [Labrus mixtus]|uniref:Fc receptor-like protein 4 isoform X3 n=2 Tax=Labrus mixtus TaxID=508554 RepID=UPI0029C0D310|nr:Fc receptor-like protein 4 isoform X3 [Labrus mixtus]
MSSMNRPHRKKPLLSYTSVQLGVQTVNMEVDALCIKLLVHMLFLLCAHVQDVDSLILRLEPNRLQFFEYESLIFHCEGSHDSTGLKIVHRSKGELLKCQTTVTSKRSSCTIHDIFPEDSGQYWCESRDGKRSDIIHITVTDGPVILESPISVVEGEAVTLRCKHKTTSTNLSADFYKDSRFIRRSSTGNMSIPSVSKRDEGFYKCNISGGRESAESLMAVQDGPVILESPISVVEGETVTLRCRHKTNSTNLSADFYKDGRFIRRSSTGNMSISSVSKRDEGFYKCIISGGRESAESLMAVQADPVILESPISVVEGETVTLRCRHKTTSSNLSADFYKDGRLIRRSSTGNMNISGVSKRDEGFYKCSISGGRESAESLMAVQENQGENFSSYSTPWIVITVLSILLLLVGLLHFGKYIRNKVMLYLSTLAPQSGPAEVQTVTVEARRVAADAPSDQAMYAAITKDRTKREQGVSRIMTATVHSAGTNRPLTQEPLYSLIKSQRDC